MHRIDHATAAAALPAAADPGAPGYFISGSPQQGTPPTIVTPDWANAVQEEISGVVEDLGFTLDKEDNGQLAVALAAALGSQLTGFIPSNAAADTDHDLEFTAGVCVNNAKNRVCRPSWSALTKQIDAPWAEGDNQGGLATGTVAAHTQYTCFLIRKNTDPQVFDIVMDTSGVGANAPVGWTVERTLFAFVTNAVSNVRLMEIKEN